MLYGYTQTILNNLEIDTSYIYIYIRERNIRQTSLRPSLRKKKVGKILMGIELFDKMKFCENDLFSIKVMSANFIKRSRQFTPQ